MSHLAEFLLNALVWFAGELAALTPERPAWFRRIVQSFWILLAALVIAAWGYGLVTLFRAL
jgi:hypothetical protein